MFKSISLFSLLFVLISALSVLGSERRYELPMGDSPFQGPENAPITMVKFLDYQ